MTPNEWGESIMNRKYSAVGPGLIIRQNEGGCTQRLADYILEVQSIKCYHDMA